MKGLFSEKFKVEKVMKKSPSCSQRWRSFTFEVLGCLKVCWLMNLHLDFLVGGWINQPMNEKICESESREIGNQQKPQFSERKFQQIFELPHVATTYIDKCTLFIFNTVNGWLLSGDCWHLVIVFLVPQKIHWFLREILQPQKRQWKPSPNRLRLGKPLGEQRNTHTFIWRKKQQLPWAAKKKNGLTFHESSWIFLKEQQDHHYLWNTPHITRVVFPPPKYPKQPPFGPFGSSGESSTSLLDSWSGSTRATHGNFGVFFVFL